MRLDPRYKFADSADEAAFVFRSLFWSLKTQWSWRLVNWSENTPPLVHELAARYIGEN